MEVVLFFNIRHFLAYEYSTDVFLEPHTLRMRPRSDATQRLINFSSGVSPMPDGQSDSLDLDGNVCSNLWFQGKHRKLSILVTSSVQTLISNPFNFMITSQSACYVPVSYPEQIKRQLDPYLPEISQGGASADFAAGVIQDSGRETLTFLCGLAAKISRSFEIVVRKSGEPLATEVTLKTRQGACRDLTLLFMEACRSEGLASRFVSGYTESLPNGDDVELHAWAEVYLPGAGWRGFDPTLGLAVADRHIAVAAAPTPAGAAPVTGSFRSDSARSKLCYQISVNTAIS